MNNKNKKITKLNKEKIECYNCSGSGRVNFRKLNKETSIHEEATVVCLICNGTGYETM